MLKPKPVARRASLRHPGVGCCQRKFETLENKCLLAGNTSGPAFEIAADFDRDGQLDYVCNSSACPDLDFGPVPPGESRTIGIGIKNIGDEPARKFLNNLTLTGTQAPDNFRMLYGSCLGYSQLPAGWSCGLAVEFAPNFDDPAGTVYGGDPTLAVLNVGAHNATDDTRLGMGMTGELVAPAEPPTGDPNDMYVWDIDFVSSRRGPHTDARIIVSINRDSNADGAASSVDADAAGVVVTVELRTSEGDLVGTYTGTTDSNGRFISERIRGLSGGNYTAEVIDLAHERYVWNGLLDPTDNDIDSDNDGLPDDELVL